MKKFVSTLRILGALALIYAVILGLILYAQRAQAADAIQIMANGPTRMAAVEAKTTTWNSAAGAIVAVSGRVNNAVTEMVAVSGRVDDAVTEIVAVSGRVDLAATALEMVAVSGRVDDAVTEIVAVSGRVDLAATALEMVAVSGRVDAVEGFTNAADTALQPGVITVTGVTNGADTAEVTVGNTLGAATVMVGWLSATAGGAATTNGLVSIAAGANTVLYSDAGSPTIVFLSHTTGTGILDITVDSPTTNYLNVVQRDGAIKSSAAMIYDGP